MKNQHLSQPIFYILLSLCQKPRHGYDIMKQVSLHSHDAITLGPGTLYGAIKRMLEDKLIASIDLEASEIERRKYYKITDKGLRVLETEINRMQQVVKTYTESTTHAKTYGYAI